MANGGRGTEKLAAGEVRVYLGVVTRVSGHNWSVARYSGGMIIRLIGSSGIWNSAGARKLCTLSRRGASARSMECCG